MERKKPKVKMVTTVTKNNYDFKGWATKANYKCSDGRTIKPGAFKDDNNKVVPLIWNHNHGVMEDFLGHALLEEHPEGVIAYCLFNDTDAGQLAKKLVKHGDVRSLSIFANQLVESAKDVIHGVIREVSLVPAGANPGAFIEDVVVHGEEDGYSAWITHGEGDKLELSHSDETKEESKETKEETKKETKDEKKKTVGDVLNELTDEQAKAVEYLMDQAIKAAIEAQEKDKSTKESEKKEEKKDSTDESEEEEEEEEKKEMKHNTFDDASRKNASGATLAHGVDDSLLNAALGDIKRYGSLKESVVQHGIDPSEVTYIQHGITDVENLHPEYQTTSAVPELIKRDTDWVDVVLNSVTKAPFAKVKSLYANITADEARAKGYVKGAKKVEEFFTAVKRTTDPATVYKLQKVDRDDILDITDFDAVSWIKSEMKLMLNEEIARAILVGDGRDTTSADKIKENCIRPIWTDDEVFAPKRVINLAADATDAQTASLIVDEAVKARKDYKGSGNPVFFTSVDFVTEALLLKDEDGRRLYNTTTELAAAMRVSAIVEVPVMEGLTRTAEVTGSSGSSSTETRNLAGIIVNLKDYQKGNDKKGEPSMFDDFDIDYNKYAYLIETRMSGALTKPYSAVVIETVKATA